MARPFLIGIVAALIAAAAPNPQSRAQDRPAIPSDAVARAALDALRRALAEALLHLPHYTAPEINDRGDIIIRRKPAPAPSPPASTRPADRPDETST
ncbi:MAG: hypothetical protein FJX57_10455 [Alphaproteobacteria bacterium]|nr:hypothetical protein [Alphaproteobacteria bacterium]